MANKSFTSNQEVDVSANELQYWIIDQIHPQKSVYNIPSVFHLKGQVNQVALEKAVNDVVRRHEILRSVFEKKDNSPVKIILHTLTIPLKMTDLSVLAPKEKKKKINQFIIEAVNEPFDLALPLLRTALFKLSDDAFVFTLTMHHIITDLHSKDLLSLEISELYNSYITEKKPQLNLPSHQYSDYTTKQKEWLESDQSKKAVSFWVEQLSNKKSFLDFPLDKPYPPVQSLNGRELYFDLPKELISSLRTLCQKEVVDIFLILLSSFCVTLHRYSAQTDMIVGVPFTNRRQKEYKGIMGCLMNILPIGLDISDDPSFREVLSRIRKSMLLAHRNQELPLSTIVSSIPHERNTSFNPLFQYGFTFEPPMQLNLNGIDAEPLDTHIHGSRLDIFTVLWKNGDAFRGKFFYNTDIFEEVSIKRIAANYKRLLEAVSQSIDSPLSEIPIVSDEETFIVLNKFNNTTVSYSNNRCIHHFLEENTELHPEKIAVFFQDKALTYKELNARSNQLAHLLISKGMKKEDIVGIFMERSLEMIISIFGIIKAGCAYLPLDPSNPKDRLSTILEDSQTQIVISQPNISSNLPKTKIELLYLDEGLSLEPDYNPSNRAEPSSLAYVIYTSGSTGKPKGVMIEHHSVINRLEWMQKRYALDADDIILQKTPYSFDVSVWEIFWWSFFNSAVCLLIPGGEKDPETIIKAVEEYNITVMHFVPSMLHAFLDYIKTGDHAKRLIGLKQVFASGEALQHSDVKNFNALLFKTNGTRLENLYGPTEATVDVSYFDCSAEEETKSIPIGKPIDNIQLYIVDKHTHIQPIGVIGELVIAGDGLARGYLNQPELTSEKFIANPFGKGGSKLYRTGDIARFRLDGNIEYFGRIDHQVKIRGLRIELGEIESQLASLGYVDEAVVMPIEKAGDKKLVAYIIPDNDTAHTVRQVSKARDENEGLTRMANGMPVFFLNKNETDFMYREIFKDNSYFQKGISLESNGCVFDVGANIGLFSIYVKANYPDSTIFAFEPIPDTFEILALNSSLYGNIRAFNLGLSDTPGEAEFIFYPHFSILSGRHADKAAERKIVESFIMNENLSREGDDSIKETDIKALLDKRLNQKKVKCNLKTISQIIDENGIKKIDLLKIDVEKSEIEVLNGIDDKDWHIVKQIVMEIHDVNENVKCISGLIEEKGFNVTISQDKSFEGTDVYNLFATSKCLKATDTKKTDEIDEARFNSDAYIERIRIMLKGKLPEYMIPSYFILLDNFPLLSNGKIDRKTLLNIKPEKKYIAGKPYSSPLSDLEKSIAGYWRDLLGIDTIGLDDNFFEIGGNSLLILKLHSRICKAFSLSIESSWLFEYPTIRKQSEFLNSISTRDNAGMHRNRIGFEENRLKRKKDRNTDATDIAVIGMAGRFPGAKNIDEFWDNLKNGRDTITHFSDEELEKFEFNYDGLIDDPKFIRAKGILEGIDKFDAPFFGFNPGEAAILDPQNRIWLETAWEALELSGYSGFADDFRIGVFAGSFLNNYLLYSLLSNRSDIEEHIRFRGNSFYTNLINNSSAYLPAMTSYKFNLKGPSVNVQTACSTSLVAIIMACQNLINLESDIAIAGGVCIAIPQETGYHYQENMIFSKDGHCRPFDAAATGTVFSNGVGAVVLKRLKDALEDHDNVLAVVKGTALNNDGSVKVSFMAPSVDGQAKAIAAAQDNAGINAETVSYIETHGTGTYLGDTIEIAGLTKAFRRHTQKRRFCGLGSVKSNVGHLDAAAGVASFIKTVLALKHGLLPPTVHLKKTNPEIDFASSPFYVVDHLTKWETSEGILRAGVSSFGIGGTNAHVILENAPRTVSDDRTRPFYILPVSANSEKAMVQATKNVSGFINTHPDINIADLSYTLSTKRKLFKYRAFLVCENNETKAAPDDFIHGNTNGSDYNIAFMFPGQGTQYKNMAVELYQHEPIFKKYINKCCDIISNYVDKDRIRILFESGDDPDNMLQVSHSAFTQLALFSLEYSLAKQWMSWGIYPSALIGHSLGEWTAACLADVVSLEDAIKAVYHRGRLMRSLPGGGAALSVQSSATSIKPYLMEGLSLAAENSPHTCVISGSEGRINTFIEKLKTVNIGCKKLQISIAVHSAMIDPIVEAYLNIVKGIKFDNPRIPIVSTVTGDWISHSEIADPAYWAYQMRRTVRFSAGIKKILENKNWIFLESGPGSMLSTLVFQHINKNGEREHIIIPSLQKTKTGESECTSLMSALGELWLNGSSINWEQFYSIEKRYTISAPTYPFDRKRYWIDPPLSMKNKGLSNSQKVRSAATKDDEETTPLESAFFSEKLKKSDETSIKEEVKKEFSRLSGIDLNKIDDIKTFDEQGFDSLFLARVTEALEKQFKINMEFRQISMDYPNIELLSRYIETQIQKIQKNNFCRQKTGSLSLEKKFFRRYPEHTNFVPIRPNGSKPPFVLVHGDRANHLIIEHLEEDRPFYGYMHLGADGELMPYEKIEDIAKYYLKQLLAAIPKGPYILGGHSFGGLIAYEMAQLLINQHLESVKLLILIDTAHPQGQEKKDYYTKVSTIRFSTIIRKVCVELPERVDKFLKRMLPLIYIYAKKPIPVKLRNSYILNSYVKSAKAYFPKLLNCSIVYFSANNSIFSSHAKKWKGLTQKEYIIHNIPGDHLSIIRDPDNCKILAENLNQYLKGTD